MWRIERDESNYSPAKKIAWHMALPHKHVPIIETDTDRARDLERVLLKLFSKQALAAAAKRLPE